MEGTSPARRLRNTGRPQKKEIKDVVKTNANG
jgi:hypothetical protein